MASPTYTLISSNTLSSTASSVTFSSIPSTYTDLVLRISARSNYGAVGDYFQITYNSTTTGYSDTVLAGNGSAASSYRNSNATVNEVANFDGASATASTFGNGEIYIPSYTASQNKPLSSFAVAETNASAAPMAVNAHLWRNTAAISSITISAFGIYQSGSSFYLYGIKSS